MDLYSTCAPSELDYKIISLTARCRLDVKGLQDGENQSS